MISLRSESLFGLSLVTLTFDALNWNVFQTVDVIATQDDIDEVPDPHQGTIVHTVTSGDPNYQGWILADMLVDITDASVSLDELITGLLAIGSDIGMEIRVS